MPVVLAISNVYYPIAIYNCNLYILLSGFPVWAIVLIVLSLLVVAGVIIAVVYCYLNKLLCFKSVRL